MEPNSQHQLAANPPALGGLTGTETDAELVWSSICSLQIDDCDALRRRLVFLQRTSVGRNPVRKRAANRTGFPILKAGGLMRSGASFAAPDRRLRRASPEVWMARFPGTPPFLTRILLMCQSIKDESNRGGQLIQETVATGMANLESDLARGMTDNTSTLKEVVKELETISLELEKEKWARNKTEQRLEEIEERLANIELGHRNIQQDQAATQEFIGNLKDEFKAEKTSSRALRQDVIKLSKMTGAKLGPSNGKDSHDGSQPSSRLLQGLLRERATQARQINTAAIHMAFALVLTAVVAVDDGNVREAVHR
ncbi:hypothetical protein B0T19DRAFT_458105 [Cercophora scortea]|uniref:Uncharacterized protein n=1 Tax=Cercophora scortea TaxID=314031 RepID=A0AAE0IY11_9PEZI|nr:hypothetical protein B0T19DRAFT_458105 [Cercophora scortea]